MVEFSHIWWDDPRFFILTQFNFGGALLRMRLCRRARNLLIKQSYCDTSWKRGQSVHMGNSHFSPYCHFKRQTLLSTSEPRNKHFRDGWVKARSKGKLMLSAWLDATQGKCRRCFKHSCTEEEGSNFPPWTSSPLIGSSVCALLPPFLARLSLEAGGERKEQRLSSLERNNFFQTPLYINTQPVHISV